MQHTAEENSTHAEVSERDPGLNPDHLQSSSESKDSSGTTQVAQKSDSSDACSTQRAAAASLAATALLAACGGGGGSSAASVSPAGISAPVGATPALPDTTAMPATGSTTIRGYTYPVATSDPEAARFLLQAQFSASNDDIAALRMQGYQTWLMAQLNAPASMTGVQWLDSRGYSAINASSNYFDNAYPGDFMVWQQLMKSTDAVRKRAALALSEIFVVSLSSIDVEWRSHAIAQYWDLLVDGAHGNFRSLLEDITLNPAMGLFLNTKGNQKEDGKGRQPDENYAREVMQLFTIGLYQLNLDGSEKRAGDGTRLNSYTLTDVSNLARVFTGYDLDQTQNLKTLVGTRNIGNTSPVLRRMTLTASRHSALAANFLGVTISAGIEGSAALKTALDALFNHPNVGPFIGKQLIQRLVTSNPSPAYVARVAGAFNNSGSGIRGDMKAVFAAVLLDDEARSPAGLTSMSFGKLREPMVRFVQWGRSFGLDSATGSWKLDQQGNSDQLGQSPLRAPSVFNFYRPGYVPPSTAIATAGQVAPEFQMVNETTVGAYLNYMQDRIRNGFNIDSPGLPEHNYTGYVRDITAPYTAELALVLDPPALVRRLSLILCAGQLTATTQTLIVNALNATTLTAASSANARLDRVCSAVLLVLASADYLIQK